MKFAFILAEKALYPILVLCEVLGVSRSGFHAWQHACLFAAAALRRAPGHSSRSGSQTQSGNLWQSPSPC